MEWKASLWFHFKCAISSCIVFLSKNTIDFRRESSTYAWRFSSSFQHWSLSPNTLNNLMYGAWSYFSCVPSQLFDGSGRTNNQKYTGSTHITDKDCKKYLDEIQRKINMILGRFYSYNSQMNLIRILTPEPVQVPHFDQVFICTKEAYIEEYDYVPLTMIYFHQVHDYFLI